MNFQMFKLEGWGTRNQIANIHWIIEAEVDVFLEFPCSLWFNGCWQFDISAFSKSNLCICKFSVHVLLQPNLKDFEHYLSRMWNEHNFTVVWTFFGIVSLWDWNENRPFPVLRSLLSFPNLLPWSSTIICITLQRRKTKGSHSLHCGNFDEATLFS